MVIDWTGSGCGSVRASVCYRYRQITILYNLKKIEARLGSDFNCSSLCNFTASVTTIYLHLEKCINQQQPLQSDLPAAYLILEMLLQPRHGLAMDNTCMLVYVEGRAQVIKIKSGRRWLRLLLLTGSG